MRVLGKKVIVVQDKAPISSGLISIQLDKPDKGTVKFIGDKVHDLTVGERVIFGKYAGVELKYKTEVFLQLDESDIIAVIGE